MRSSWYRTSWLNDKIGEDAIIFRLAEQIWFDPLPVGKLFPLPSSFFSYPCVGWFQC